MYVNGVGVAVLVNARHRAPLNEDRGRRCDRFVPIVLWAGAPDDGESPTHEAEPTPGGEDCVEKACGLNPSPVLCIAAS